MDKSYYKCSCSQCSWRGLFELGDPADVVYHEPVGKDVIRVVVELPKVCPECGKPVSCEERKNMIRY